MKKILTLFVLILLCCTPAHAFGLQKARIEQNKIQKVTVNEIKNLIDTQDKFANSHDLSSLKRMYSKDFTNSDGFDYDVYMKLIEDTWQTYPDITYKTKINNVNIDGNFASVEVTETAFATPKEKFGEYEVIGELYSVSKCIYYMEKYGTNWLIASEKILEETSTLKFGEARFIDITLSAPKQIGSGKSYTASLNVNSDRESVVIASIDREKIVYPQADPKEAFRTLSDEGYLERVFISNDSTVNEYVTASIGITYAKPGETQNKINVYMGGMAFIMTRVNVIPENKFVDIKEE